MRVINIYDLCRNDCTMDCECEYCGKVEKDKYAYNDANYIHNVVPSRYCSSCGKNAKGEIKPIETDTTTLAGQIDNG